MCIPVDSADRRDIVSNSAKFPDDSSVWVGHANHPKMEKNHNWTVLPSNYRHLEISSRRVSLNSRENKEIQLNVHQKQIDLIGIWIQIDLLLHSDHDAK